MSESLRHEKSHTIPESGDRDARPLTLFAPEIETCDVSTRLAACQQDLMNKAVRRATGTSNANGGGLSKPARVPNE